jgi:photosystem II stability/assembly factor-like uncharacterized protein
MEKRLVLRYGLVLVVIVVLVLVLNVFRTGFTGNSAFTGRVVYEESGSDFDSGTYVNVIYNGSAIVLNEDNLTGTYTSQVFDAGSDSTWNNLSWIGGMPNVEFLYGVDGGGDVYKSSDYGISWSMVKEDYGRTSDTSYMFSDEVYVYILAVSNREVWRSNNDVDWIVINDTFANSGLLVGGVDSLGNLFAIDASGDVYLSGDYGINWDLKGDFNDAATNNAKGLAINSSNALFVVDGSGEVYSSVDSGVSWLMVNESYGGSTGTDDMVEVNGDIFILWNKDVYGSQDNGVTWNLVNDSFTPYSNDGLRFGFDSSENIYIADSSGRVFKSDDGGVSWVEKDDFNAGAGSDPKGLTNFLESTNLSFQIRNCSLNDCSDGSWQSVDLDSFSLVGRYFQYKVDFESPGTFVSPSLENVSVDYDVINNAPVVSIFYPENTSYTYQTSFDLNFSSSDSDGNLDSCWYSLNGGNNSSLAGCNNISLSLSSGSYSLVVYANDSNGLESSDSVSFGIDKANGVTSLVFDKISPQNTGINLNATCSIVSGEGSVVLYRDGVDVTSYENGNNVVLSSGNYNYECNLSETQNYSSFTNQSVFEIVNTLPILSLDSPQDGATYGYNESLNLNFSVSDSEDNLDSCWYNLDGNGNLSLSGCLNVSFNVSGNGNYVLNIYSNDSEGLESKDNASFSVQVGSPTIVLDLPIDTYFSEGDIEFNYTPSDLDLASCELWGNFNGSFDLNQTDDSPSNGIINNFNLTLVDGEYLWNVRCSDDVGNFAFNGNKTFYVDMIDPSLSVSEPNGEKTSRTEIPLEFSVFDASPVSCLYNVYSGASLEVANTSIDCSQSSSFDVSVDANFVLNFYVNDSAGNVNSVNSSFSVSTSGGGSGGSSGGGSSGGGGGGGAVITKKSNESSDHFVEISDVGSIISKAGEEETLSLNVKNIGKSFLNNCRVTVSGDISSWFYSDQIEGVAPGQNLDFVFSINIPEGSSEGDYFGDLELKCDEIIESQEVKVSIVGNSGAISIDEILQEKDILEVNYVFDNSNFIGNEIGVDIWVVDSDEIEIKRVRDIFPINKDGLIERGVLVELPEDLVGIYYVYVALSSDLEDSVKQSVVLGKSVSTGMVVFADQGKMTGYIVFLFVIGGMVFFIIRRNRKESKNIKGSLKQ